MKRISKWLFVLAAVVGCGGPVSEDSVQTVSASNCYPPGAQYCGCGLCIPATSDCPIMPDCVEPLTQSTQVAD